MKNFHINPPGYQEQDTRKHFLADPGTYVTFQRAVENGVERIRLKIQIPITYIGAV